MRKMMDLLVFIRQLKQKGILQEMLSCSPFAVYSAHKHVLKCRHTWKDTNQLKGPSNAPSADLMRFESNQVFPIETDSSFVGAIDASDDVEEGSLSSPIWPDQPNNISLIHVKGDIREDR